MGRGAVAPMMMGLDSGAALQIGSLWCLDSSRRVNLKAFLAFFLADHLV